MGQLIVCPIHPLRSAPQAKAIKRCLCHTSEGSRRTPSPRQPSGSVVITRQRPSCGRPCAPWAAPARAIITREPGLESASNEHRGEADGRWVESGGREGKGRTISSSISMMKSRSGPVSIPWRAYGRCGEAGRGIRTSALCLWAASGTASRPRAVGLLPEGGGKQGGKGMGRGLLPAGGGTP